jgi:hypothetical protein
MDVDAFLAQGAEYDAGGDVRDGVLKLLSLRGRWHPFTAVRALELQRWTASGAYERVLQATIRGATTTARRRGVRTSPRPHGPTASRSTRRRTRWCVSPRTSAEASATRGSGCSTASPSGPDGVP